MEKNRKQNLNKMATQEHKKKADLESIFSSASGSAENKGEVEPTAGPRQEEIPPKRHGRI